MTLPPLPGRVAAPGGALDSAAADGSARNTPVIVLTYANAGAFKLRQQVLESQPELTCTAATGVLAACDQAVAAWRQVEGLLQDDPLPTLASKSVRAMATQMITMLVVHKGGRRWCETASAEPSAAETFLQVFPGTRFICLHRSCPDVISATLQSTPWGLSGPGYAPYVMAHPRSTVAALAAWWAAHADQLLTFERAHPQDCLRVRYEDFTADPSATEDAIRAFLGLTANPTRLPAILDDAPEPSARGTSDLPVGQLAARLLNQVNELHAELGYPPLPPT